MSLKRRREFYAEFITRFYEPRRAQIVGCEILEGRHDDDIRDLLRAFGNQ